MTREFPAFPGGRNNLPEEHGPLRVGFSGGPDSHALIHWLAKHRSALSVELSAIHVNHGLHPASHAWADRCREICAELGVHLDVISTDATPRRRESPEDAARGARYEAFAALVRRDEVLVLAHHQDDQSETVLLQLLRGAGVGGLAAMPRLGRFREAWLWRPFIDVSRATLRRYNADHRLSSIEDPGNDDLSLDRNLLRHKVFPILRQRWPSAGATVSRAARNCAEARTITDEVAARDLRSGRGAGDSLRIDVLLGLSDERRRNVLRFWLRQLGLETPSAAHVARIEVDMIGARADRTPCVRWGNTEVRRFRDHLYAMPKQRPNRLDFRVPISPQGSVVLPDLSSVGLEPGGELGSALIEGQRLEVGFRQGGERLRPPGSSHRRTLKHLYQEAGVPPWDRDHRPLLLVDGVPAAVAGLWVDRDFIAPKGDAGLRFTWQKSGSPDKLRCR